jgi:hypothetical protein
VLPLGPITSSLNTTYTAAQVAAMLVQPSLALRYLFDLLNPSFNYKSDLTPLVTAAQIDHDTSRAIKRSLRINFWRPVSNADVLKDVIRVRGQILAPDGGWLEWRLGLFRFTPPAKAISELATGWDVTAPDLSQSLVSAAFPSSFGVPGGYSLAAAVSLIAASYGGPVRWRVMIADNGARLGASQSWDAGTSRIKAINDLCAAFAYTSIWVDGTTLRAQPVPDYMQTPAVYSFDTTQGMTSALSPIQEVADYTNAFNQYLVNGEDPNRAANGAKVSGYYENANPDSPVSIPNWEPRMAPPISDSKIPDNITARARAKAEAQRSARIYGTLSLPFLPNWFFGQDLDAYNLIVSTADEGVVARKYLNTKWTLPCTVQTAPTMDLQRIVAW